MDQPGEITGQLKRLEGDFSEEISLRGNMVTIGRGMNNNCIWDSLQISRQHCSLEFNNGSWHLRNTSTNGILLNGRPIAKNCLIKLNNLEVIDFIPTGTIKYRFIDIHRNQSSSSGGNEMSSSSTTNKNLVYNDSPEPMIINDNEDSNESESLLSIGSDHCESIIEVSSKSEIPKRKKKNLITNLNLKKTRIKDDDVEELPDIDIDVGKSKSKRNVINEDCVLETSQSLLSNDEDELMEIQVKSSNNSREKKNNEFSSGIKDSNNSDNNVKELLKDDFNDVKALKMKLQELVTTNQVLQAEKQLMASTRNIEKEETQRTIIELKDKIAQTKDLTNKNILTLLEQEFNCTICSELFVDATVINCGHTFCTFCIHQWIKKKPECPVCRAEVIHYPRHNVLDNLIQSVYALLPAEMNEKRNEVIKERAEYIQAVKAEEKEKAAAAAQARNNMGGAGRRRPLELPFDEILAGLDFTNYADFELFPPSPPQAAGRRRGSARRGPVGARVAVRHVPLPPPPQVQPPPQPPRTRSSRGGSRARNVQLMNIPPPAQPPPPPAVPAQRHNRLNIGNDNFSFQDILLESLRQASSHVFGGLTNQGDRQQNSRQPQQPSAAAAVAAAAGHPEIYLID